MSAPFPSNAGRPPTDVEFLAHLDAAHDARALHRLNESLGFAQSEIASLQEMVRALQVAARERDAYRQRCADLEHQLDGLQERYEALVATLAHQKKASDP